MQSNDTSRTLLPISCHICRRSPLAVLATISPLVASDIRPVDHGATIASCRSCGTIQKVTDDAWRSATEQIYEKYEVFSADPDHEQEIFVDSSSQSRSTRLISFMQEHMRQPAVATLLDFGCASGLLLRAIHRAYPETRLAGLEIDMKYRDRVCSIADRVEYFGDGHIPSGRRFDLITMSHVLEHLVDPIGELRALRNALAEDGRLLITVPDLRTSPFDLMIADHCTHFTAETLRAAVESAGFTIEAFSGSWLPKELTLIARVDDGDDRQHTAVSEKEAEALAAEAVVTDHLLWIQAQYTMLDGLKGDFAVFGSSIAAAIFGAKYRDRVLFFVDEDRSRSQSKLLGKLIWTPEDAPNGVPLFLALPAPIARAVATRQSSRFDMILLPAD